MAEYRRRSDGLLVDSVHALKTASPNVSFPDDLKEATLNGVGWDVVQEESKPTTTVYQQAVRNGAVQDDIGRWKQSYELKTLDKTTVRKTSFVL